MKATISLISSLTLLGVVGALPAITRTGKYLYGADGNRFFIKGIAYQQPGTLGPIEEPGGFPEPIDFIDELSIPSSCARDVPNLTQLGVNAVRVYSVDASLDHSECMSALDSAGIYALIDLSLPVNGSITRIEPAWTSNLLTLYLNTIDTFLQYNNVLAFNIGNEVVNNAESTVAGPFIKAAARDIKAYLKSKGSSALVAYASTDGQGWRDPLAEYLTCDTEETSIDLYGLNNYRWCGQGTIADYQEAITAFENLPVPAYFSEYGCIQSRPRVWTEVAAIYGPEMSEVFSGGVAFSYFPTNDDYGITTLSGDSISTTGEFTSLQSQLTAITSFINTPAQSAATQPPYPACPAQSDQWLASSTLPPTPNQAECDCVWNYSPCVFSPQTVNQSALYEELFASSCTLLGENGGSCDPIGANGATGTYGQLSGCDGPTKLSYVFSQFYVATNNNAQSCDFAGNATVNAGAPTTTDAINAGISSCVAATPDVYTPSEPTALIGTGQTSTPRPGGSGTAGGAAAIFVSTNALIGMITVSFCTLATGVLIL